MVLGKLPVPGRPTIWITVGQGPTVLAVGAGGGCLDIFTLDYPFCPLSPSLWETAQYRLKYCLKGPLNPKILATEAISHIPPSKSEWKIAHPLKSETSKINYSDSFLQISLLKFRFDRHHACSSMKTISIMIVALHIMAL